ncbi:alanine--tRNA ligase [Haliangium ochraceum]|uniref:Alanine--tRNA ligase n=1 Tax=Haliangium ochraceum (strain DSM 14365 / JCM 11303 / SMP-2) TaxID=502025 RepID=D0LZ22_HALO1|nr:alanine--tRNA ligase [Haliangium ochraceum]ACY14492.1 alanyl-tRNA synthetase [Haliangium ochraceum DSM 14365]
MKAAQVRSSFLDFFAARGHERVHSASLVPVGDPTLLFTNAGMVPFKDVFTGHQTRAIPRATSSQKCVRAGGKHNDLDQVGKTARHHTFFEMLGNFSFGDYFKKDAIAWAWELLTEVYGIDKERLVITVFAGDSELGVGADDEARAIWGEVTGMPSERIIGLGKSENFWMMGETGPMGPCSEIHYFGAGKPDALPGTDPDAPVWSGWLEIWNLVFMQYERREPGGALHKLPAPSIDTGAGLERVTSVLQGVSSNYDTDLFQPLLHSAAELCGKRYGEDGDADTSMRVIADHARATAFLVADGVFPDKTDKEYVLRRIFRRAVRHGKLLGIEEPFMHRMCARVVEEMKDAYPELAERATVIHEITLEEEKRFRATLDRGLNLLEEEFGRMQAAKSSTVSGDKVFQLYDTYGFPSDLTEIIADEHGYGIDHEGFREELEQARERSKAAHSTGVGEGEVFKTLAGELGATSFLGYEGEGLSGSGQVMALVVDGERVERAEAGAQVAFACDQTPFYAESGGQIGDCGEARSEAGARVRIDDTRKPSGDTFVHIGEVLEGAIALGDQLGFEVDGERRARIRANHSATHLLHLALKKTLGDHVAQKGSSVGPDRLRFDFAHFSPMSDEQTQQVEDWVNAEIRKNRDSVTDVMSLSEAKERGAVAMFGEKYGDKVRVVGIGSESLEFCGGTHVHRAGDIGLFKIVSESSVAQGVRRIEAVTGAGALEYVRRVEGELSAVGGRLKVAPLEVAGRVDKLQEELRAREREVAELKAKLAAGGSRDLMSEVEEIAGVKVLAVATEVDDAKTLRTTGDTLRDRLGSGVLLLCGVGEDKVALLAMVSKDLTKRVHAGKLLQAVAETLGGRGGGRPDMAQGGGKDPSQVPAALERARSFLNDALA